MLGNIIIGRSTPSVLVMVVGMGLDGCLDIAAGVDELT